MAKRRRRAFNSEKNARSFAKKVGGQFNDLRNIPGAHSKFSVTYLPNEKTRKHGQGARDFTGPWPEDYWK